MPCAKAGSPEMTIGLSIGGFAMALMFAGAIAFFCKQRAMKLFATIVEAASSVNSNESGQQAAGAALAEESKKKLVGEGTWAARLLELGGRLGVKARILISLAQVSTEPKLQRTTGRMLHRAPSFKLK
jgi:hypothetical protein